MWWWHWEDPLSSHHYSCCWLWRAVGYLELSAFNLLTQIFLRTMMVLTRGSGGLCPCPVCLVPQDKQHILGVQPLHPLRQHSDAQPFVENKTLKKKALEQIIQPLGIRPVEVIQKFSAWSKLIIPCQNVFWDLPYTNVHAIVSWDRLHAYHGGLFSDHIFDQFQEIVKGLGRPTMNGIDTRYLQSLWKVIYCLIEPDVTSFHVGGI